MTESLNEWLRYNFFSVFFWGIEIPFSKTEFSAAARMIFVLASGVAGILRPPYCICRFSVSTRSLIRRRPVFSGTQPEPLPHRFFFDTSANNSIRLATNLSALYMPCHVHLANRHCIFSSRTTSARIAGIFFTCFMIFVSASVDFADLFLQNTISLNLWGLGRGFWSDISRAVHSDLFLI